MKNLISNTRKTLMEQHQFEMVDDDQALNLQGGLKNDKDLFREDIDVKNIWHQATSIFDDLV